ncbi:hypothetical protein [Domibacillus antri]|uniref:hypothetical protein n=1 Tax=Domibacillus antri TaxID=1714264 RepID=UPI0031834A65
MFEYFNQYLSENAIGERTTLQNEKMQKLQKQLSDYSENVQQWLLQIYEDYDKQIHRSIISQLKKEELFLLYFQDSDFRSCSYEIYANLVKRNPFLKGQTEYLFAFIKDHHRIKSEEHAISKYPFISEEINNWVENTQEKYSVNLFLFASEYAERFYDDSSLWPVRHRKKSKEGYLDYEYDYKQKANLFNINTLYTRISDRPFMRKKKQMLEVLLMYVWLHSIDSDKDNYWEEYCSKVIKSKD